jgi:hypothetical protein
MTEAYPEKIEENPEEMESVEEQKVPKKPCTWTNCTRILECRPFHRESKL